MYRFGTAYLWQRRVENRYCCYDGREGQKTDAVATMVEKGRKLMLGSYDGIEGQKTDAVATMVQKDRKLMLCCYDGKEGYTMYTVTT